MDFHSLSRRELQALCKKNKIPANMTNLAMADALAALPQLEGLEELLSQTESNTEQLLRTDPCVTAGDARTATRTSTRKPTKEIQEPGSSVMPTGSCCRTRKLLQTPSAPTTRRRTNAASARGKVVIVGQEDDKDKMSKNVPKDEQVMTGKQKKPMAQKVYSTRRSARLLEKTMANLTLKDNEVVEPIKMNDLDMETAENDANNDQVISTHVFEMIDDDADSLQNYSAVPKSETEVEDVKEKNTEMDNSLLGSDAKNNEQEGDFPVTNIIENAEIDSSSSLSDGVENTLSGSDAKNSDHEADYLVNNMIQKETDLGDGYVVKMGGDSSTEVPEENASFGITAVKSSESAPVVVNHLGVHSSTSQVGDSEEYTSSEGPLASHQHPDETLPQEGINEAIPQNVSEVPSLPEGQVKYSQEMESGSKFDSMELPIEYISQEGINEAMPHKVLEVPSLPEGQVSYSQELESGSKFDSLELPESNVGNSISISAGLMPEVEKENSSIDESGLTEGQVNYSQELESGIKFDSLEISESNVANSISISAGLMPEVEKENSCVDESGLTEGQVNYSQELESGSKFDSLELLESNVTNSISISAGLMSEVEKENSSVDESGLTEGQVNYSQELESGSKFDSLELLESNVTNSISISAGLISEVEKENSSVDESGLTEFTATQTMESVYESPATESLMETGKLAVTDPHVMTLEDNIQLMPKVESGEEAGEFPQPLACKLETAVYDEDKENISSSTLDGDCMLTPLNDKSLRQLAKMLKEKLQIANRESNDTSMQQQSGKILQALQGLALPDDNCMTVAKTGEN
ncbi:hypothetical protein SAY86_023719 [Trapa natans]|uniref:Uncharacterized protein n=1 Tax=Trapa natans TaxID=22666 RepID=A0AAN7LW93_TRANT|nr:hypothetical protein SAY86_023719 [Trapa natans]